MNYFPCSHDKKLSEIEDEIIYLREFLSHKDSEMQDHEIEMHNKLKEMYQKTEESWNKIIKLLED